MFKQFIIVVLAVVCMTACSGKKANPAQEPSQPAEVQASAAAEVQAPAAQPEKASETASEGIAPRKLFLSMAPTDPEKTSFIGAHGTEQGTFSVAYLYDAMVEYRFERLERVVNGLDDVERAIKMLEIGNDARDFKVEKTDEITKVDIPVYKVTYLIGHNEDTRVCRDYYMTGEKNDYRFHTSAGADFVEDYNAVIDGWVASLALVDEEWKLTK